MTWTEVVPRRDVPVVLLSRDQLSPLRALVAWLEDTGHERLILLDNASTYPPLLDYLAASPHEVVRVGANLAQTAPWETGVVTELKLPFVVSDPDLLPDEACPADALEYFQELLLRHRAFDKAGFGLLIDDLPEHYPHREAVRAWEEPFWEREEEPGVFAAHIDTTFAVHRPGTPYKVTEALRTGYPYVMRHLPWYRDPLRLDDETSWFHAHRRADIGFWDRIDLPERVARRLI